jgi:uncharacterized protein YjdB
MRTIFRILVFVLGCMAVTGMAFGKSSSSVTLASSSNPSTYGSSVMFTATVTPSAATGTVTFKDGSTTLGTGTISSGKATFSTSTLSAGSHSVTASYGGDASYNGSTSSVLTQTVNKANTTITLTSSANPSVFGSSVKFTATVTPSAATGTVTFKDGSTTLGTGTISSGKATFSISTLAAGSHSITASYGGNTNYNGSTSAVLTQVVNKANTTVTLASSANPSAYGSSVTFTATVSPSAATGTVTFKDGSTTLGTGTISSGKAAFSTSTLALGSHSITASYGGDTNYNGSTSKTLTQTVKQASTVALTSSANPSPYGTTLTFTATVWPSAATGTMTFYDGSTVLGTGTIASGTANYATSTLALGSHSITAVYGGNSTYAGSTSPILTQNVLTITAISVTPQNASLSVGATQQFTATGTFSDNSQGNVTSSVVWTSSDVTVATISSAGIATGAAEGPTTIQAAVGAINGSASLSGTPSKFRFAGSLKTTRIDYTATTLQNGSVLIASGYVGGGKSTAESELYNPVTGTFAPTGTVSTPRFSHTATLLQNGNVLIVGGTSATGSTTSAELYTPSTGSFTPAASLNIARSLHTATLLQNGQVLVVGGSGDATAEVYDPTANTFTYTAGNLNTVLNQQSATLLNDGTVLIAGGATNDGQASVATAEIYSPTAGTFAPTGNLNAGRTGHTASLLTTGKVLIATGYNIATYLPLTTAELYDPVAKTFTVTGAPVNPRSYATATLLNSGQVLVVGGVAASNGTSEPDLGPAELYDPTSATFSLAGNLNIARDSHSAALLNDGTVLISGGRDSYFYETGYFEDFIPQAEIYQSSGIPEPPDSLQITPASANVIVGGTQHFTAIDSNGNPRTDVTWTVSNPSVATVTTDEHDSGVLTGIAAGQVTLTANAETASAQEQVTILAAGSYPAGTVIWSAPPLPGFSPLQLVQAVPTPSGPDFYSIQLSNDGTQSVVQALTADGRQLWQTTLPALNNNSVPDGGGGLLVEEYDTCTTGQTNPLTVVDLDPVYGQPTLQILAAGIQQGNGILYCYGHGDAPQIAIRGDGAVIVSEPSNNGFPPLTMAQNGGTATYGIPTSTITTNGVTIYPQCCMGPPMVNVDGTAYVEYEVRNVVNDIITSDTLYLFQIDTNNSSSSTVLSSTTQNEALLPGPITTDGQGGILATWTISPSNPPVPQYPYQVVDVLAGAVGTPYNLPFSPTTVTFGQSPTLVLGENGVAFATDGTDAVNGPVVASFNVSSGSVNWSYQGSAQNKLSIIASAAGNGLVAKATDQTGSDTVIRFDSNGAGVADTWTGAQIDYYATGGVFAGVGSGNAIAAYFAAPIQEASAAGTRPRGDPQHNGTTDPGLVLVATQDCHKSKQINSFTLYARYPIYSLRLPTNPAQKPQCNAGSGQCYTVFEFIPQNQTACGVGGFSNLSPCSYADGSAQYPYNEFDDEISTGLYGSSFDKRQYFDYGLPNQRLFGVKQIYMTLPSGSLQRKLPNPSFNLLHAAPQTDPLIDGQLDPWLAPWDGTPASCDSAFSLYFP